MARRAAGGTRAGMYLPQLADGVKAQAAHLDQSFHGMRHLFRDAVVDLQPVTVTADVVWSALYAVDAQAAADFRVAFPRSSRSEPETVFDFDPTTNILQPHEQRPNT